MPYIDLNPDPAEPVFADSRTFPERAERPHDSRAADLLFLIHEPRGSIGGVQRHNARLKVGLSRKFTIEDYNWKAPVAALPVNLLRLHRKTKAGNYSLIYCDDAVSAMAAIKVCSEPGNILIATVHGLDIIASITGYQIMVRQTLRRLDRIISVSRATAEQAMARGADAAKVSVIPNAAEEVSQLIPKDDGLYNEIHSLTGVDFRDRTILFSLGRPLRRKGFDKFIVNVFPYLPESCVYVVAGPKPRQRSRAGLLKYIPGKRARENLDLALGRHTVHDELIELSDHPRVYYFNGVSERLRNCLYALADLFIMPNRTVKGDMEGFGIVALEAAVRGVPVIATGIEGIIDAVINGENGYLAAEDDDVGMARIIKSLLDDPVRLASLGEHAREYTLKKFGFAAHIAGYERVFEELIRND